MFAYIVRCNFTAPDREAEWNAWYGGPKIVQMLENPYFRSGQRFRRVAGSGRNYLALWIVQTPEAMTTPKYRSQWGFVEWTPLITDWSRDLFDGGNATETAFAIAPNESLRVISFEGSSADEAAAAQGTMAAALPRMMWLPIAGLDRHTPLIGLQRAADASAPAPNMALSRVQDAIYRPISKFHVAAA